MIARDGGRCQWTVEDRICGEQGTDVDHIVPGDDHRLERLQLLCRRHHQAKSSWEGGTARGTNRRPPEPHPGLL